MKRELIEITPRIRVENGPARGTAIAVAEMAPELDEQGTADPNKQTRAFRLADGTLLAPHYKIGLKDAAGRKIVAGKPFQYLDYYGELVWYVYKLQPVGFNAKGEALYPKDNPLILRALEPEDEEAVRSEDRFLPVNVLSDRDQALLFAAGLKEAPDALHE